MFSRPFPKGAKPPFPVSNRGWHGLPASYHKWWIENRGADVVRCMHRMGANFWLLLTDGDSWVEMVVDPINGKRKPVARFLLDHDICPVYRDSSTRLPKSYSNQQNVALLSEVHQEFVADLVKQGRLEQEQEFRPMITPWNEWFDDREGNMGDPDSDKAWERLGGLWNQAAGLIIREGGCPGFADGPCFPRNPFPWLDIEHWLSGYAFYSMHNYGKGRPKNYPWDVTSLTGYEHYDFETGEGQLLTWAEYMEQLGPYGDPEHPEHRQWVEEPLELINQRRMELANPNPYPWTHPDADDTCWNAWRKVVAWALDEEDGIGFIPPMAMTEGGWQRRDRAGSGPNTDIRWPHTTRSMVAIKTLEMWEADSPFFAFMPWLFADDDFCQAGYVGWPFDAAIRGWADLLTYGYEKEELIALMEANPPGSLVPGPAEQIWREILWRFESIMEMLQ